MLDIRDIRLDSLTDAELSALGSIVYDERARRVGARVDRGEIPLPSTSERLLWRSGSRTEAINNYRTRTGVGVAETHFVFSEIVAKSPTL